MAGARRSCPSKPIPEFVETFGIALVESMLAGGGPVITTTTGGIGEAVGDCALFIGVEDPDGIAAALDHAVLVMTDAERADLADRALRHALQFDRTAVYERLIARIPAPGTPPEGPPPEDTPAREGRPPPERGPPPGRPPRRRAPAGPGRGSRRVGSGDRQRGAEGRLSAGGDTPSTRPRCRHGRRGRVATACGGGRGGRVPACAGRFAGRRAVR